MGLPDKSNGVELIDFHIYGSLPLGCKAPLLFPKGLYFRSMFNRWVITSEGISNISDTFQVKMFELAHRQSSSRSILSPSGRRALTWINLTESFPRENESSYSISSPLFSISLWSKFFMVGTLPISPSFGAIWKHWRANCWSPCISLTPFLVRK